MEEDSSHYLGKIEEFNHPRRFNIENRNVAVWLYKGNVYAIDANCYHSSGHLEMHVEDIEDIQQEPCIRCPIHKYVISLKTGHSFYQPVQVKKVGSKVNITKLDWKSNGYKQRIHYAYIKDDKIYLRINKDNKAVESDKYNQN